jgi:hypothetical protein
MTDATMTEFEIELLQLIAHSPSALAAWTGAVLIADRGQQHHIGALPLRGRTSSPSPQPPIHDAQHSTGTQRDSAPRYRSMKLNLMALGLRSRPSPC